MLPASYTDLVEAFRLLPGVGGRSAERFALFLLQTEPRKARQLAAALVEAVEKIQACPRCGFYTDAASDCIICQDPKRAGTLICVVEQASDVMRMEKTKAFHGRYHVLGGRLSPLDGIGPEQLRVESLLARVVEERVEEVVLALSADVEGETTGLYLAPLLKERGARVTRLATGLPAGGGLEFADSVTVGYAFSGRRDV
jgi:recombination protein RecR